MKYWVMLALSVAVLLGISASGEAHGRRFRGHFVPRHHVFVGGAVFVGPNFWAPYPYWRDPWYPVYAPPPVVIEKAEPQTYVQQPAQQTYWYFCPDAKAYYPYVQQCPQGWLKVVPEPAAPTR
jgi:hypothetical protein